MTADSVTMECGSCGTRWEVLPRPDGTMPAGARCPKARGGCGKVRKVPRSAGVAAGSALAPAAAWDPPSERRAFRDAGGTCSDCHAPVRVEPRGTALWCTGCRAAVTPPGVLAPYKRGAEVTRAAKSQRERDLEALDLAGRKGIMLSQLRAVADDDRLDLASLPKVEWFAEQVKTAANATRLHELAALWSEAGIRPRRWWQAKPAAITAGNDDEDQADEDQADEDQADEAAVIVLADPASTAGAPRARPQRMTWAEALAACGWRLAPAAGACQVIDEHGRRCAGPTGAPPIRDALGRHAWLCQPHYGTLGALIIEANRSRGVA